MRQLDQIWIIAGATTVAELLRDQLSADANCVVLESREVILSRLRTAKAEPLAVLADAGKLDGLQSDLEVHALLTRLISPLVAYNDRPNADLMLKAVRAGARDFVTLSDSHDEWREAITRWRTLRTRAGGDLDRHRAQASTIQAARLSYLRTLSATVANELRNPLTVIINKASLLPMYFEDGILDDEKIKDSATRVLRNAFRLNKIVGGLLDFSKRLSEPVYRPESVSSIIDEVCAIHAAAGPNHVQVQGTANGLWINCDRFQIIQLFLELLQNAETAVKGSDVKEVQIEVAERDTQIEFQIQDSGPGLPSHIAKHLFEHHFSPREAHSSGFGLCFAKAIVSQHGGMIELDADQPRTCFRVAIPKAVAPDVERESAA